MGGVARGEMVLHRPILCLFLMVVAASMACGEESSWRKATPGWTYEFPKDEFSHDDFKTEWWYFTGNLAEVETGRRFGYQLTFFRQGVRPPDSRTPVKSNFVVDHVWLAHFAISDLKNKDFYFDEKFSRGAFGKAGSGEQNRLVWINDWVLKPGSGQGDVGNYQFTVDSEEFGLELELATTKPPVFHGEDGVSVKSPDPSNASHYYALTSIASNGTLRIKDREFKVTGKSWYDREWSTSILSRDQVGWDWFAMQFEDGTELMLFQLRNPEGGVNFSNGTFIAKDGSTNQLKNGEFELVPDNTWKSKQSGGTYPVSWKASVPRLNLDLSIRAAFPDQELRLNIFNYWEGATIISGDRTGRGYLEMTGYAGQLQGLSE